MRLWRRLRDDERGGGYVAAFIVLFSVMVVAAAGVLIDSARMFAADRQCSTIALEAARAAANQIERDGLLAGGGVAVDPVAARAAAFGAAASFVSESEASLQSVTVDGDRVTVVVSAWVSPWFPLLGARSVTERASAEATLGP
jgi:hypothetical protein